ncbi:MAG: hydrolase [Paenibacillus sp.]|nr:hydrolase [Paenibacillus sp.]
MKVPILYGSVHLLFYRGEDEVLLLKRQNTGFEDGKWSVVAGRMDGGEEVKAAAVREAKEEAGVEIALSEVEVIGVMHRKNTTSEWIDFFLKVHSWKGQLVNAEPHKCEELRWFKLNGLPEPMVPYIRQALTREHNGMWFESVNW